jgi:hypothetical protein
VSTQPTLGRDPEIKISFQHQDHQEGVLHTIAKAPYPPHPADQTCELLRELASYPKDCLVLYTDSDVLFQDSWEVMRATFAQEVQAKGKRVLFGADCE